MFSWNNILSSPVETGIGLGFLSKVLESVASQPLPTTGVGWIGLAGGVLGALAGIFGKAAP